MDERSSLSYYSEDPPGKVTLRGRVFGSCVWQSEEELQQVYNAMCEAMRAGKTFKMTKQKRRVKTDKDLARWHSVQFTPTCVRPWPGFIPWLPSDCACFLHFVCVAPVAARGSRSRV